MYISKVIIQNFKNFKNTEIEFNEGINVIIGPNNSGKTNLLKALALVLDKNRQNKLGVEDFNKSIDTQQYFEVDNSTGKLKMESPPSIGISIFITESTGQRQHNEYKDDNNTIYDWRIKTTSPYEAKLTYKYFLPEGDDIASYQNAVQSLIQRKATSSMEYWKLIRRIFIPKYVSRRYVGNEHFKRRVDQADLSKFDFQFLEAIRDVESDLFTGANTLLKDVLNYFLDDDVRIDESLTDEQKIAAVEQRTHEFEENSAKLIKFVKNRINIDPILKYSKDVGASLGGEPDFDGEISEVELFTALRLIIKQETGITLPASHNGLGYNNLIFISILLSKMQMSSSNYVSLDDKIVFPMLLIEEPEAHLHPSMQFKLLKFLKENLQKKKQVRQVFVTSHSTHITAAVELDEIICLNINETGLLEVAYPGKVFEPDNDEDQKSKAYVKRFLDATKSDMLFAKRVILVEGVAEQLLMSCLADYEKQSLEDKHVAIINIGGRYFDHFLKLFRHDEKHTINKYAINKKIACVTDADPTKKENIDRAQSEKCYPYEVNVDPSHFEYASLSSTLQELNNSYRTHKNITICSRIDGKGKTFEYELAFKNPACKTLLTRNLAKNKELEKLMEDYENEKNLEELLARSTSPGINKLIRASSTWSEDDNKKALIASRYLLSIENSKESGKGEHALELEYKLRKNLTKGNPTKFTVPNYIKEAINYVCN